MRSSCTGLKAVSYSSAPSHLATSLPLGMVALMPMICTQQANQKAFWPPQKMHCRSFTGLNIVSYSSAPSHLATLTPLSMVALMPMICTQHADV